MLGDSDDVIVGATASSIASLLVKGTADGPTRFAAGKFAKKPSIGGQVISDPTADARFNLA